ncbi:MAG TPA: aminopeptidase [Thermoplasmata archaeon]|nr:aminopeptidase [Thermoplasmata archaeon]
MPGPESKVAHAVLKENLKVKSGETVVVESWTHTLPLARAFTAEARRLGAQPTVLYEDEAAWWEAVDSKKVGPVSRLSDVERSVIKNADVFIYLWGPEDRPRVDGLPEAMQNRLVAWNEEWYRLARQSGLRGCRMMVAQATDPAAKSFGLEGARWRSRLLEAGASDARRMESRGERIVRLLERGDQLRVRHRNGTDLTLQLEGIHTRLDAGYVSAAALKRPYGMLANNPTGQILVAVDRASAEGRFVSNRTVYLGSNRFGEMAWTLKSGHLTAHSCGLGGETFEKQFAAAPEKGRDQLGYFSLGLNPGARDLPPVEDTEEGAILVGVGRNAMVGGKNQSPFIGYALLGEGTIDVDGQTIARGGRLV